jgi:hypothetical protein
MTSLAAPGTGTGFSAMLVNALTGVYRMESMTPRTDAVATCEGLYSDDPIVILARELERELAQAKENAATNAKLLNELYPRLALAEAKIAELEREVFNKQKVIEWNLQHSDLQAVAQLEKDAARYRWLRSAGWFDDAIMEREHMNELFPETIDAAIDAALSKGRK